jgi:twinfilin-like protein
MFRANLAPASPDLQREFASFLSNPSLRGLLVSISKSPEELVPVSTIPSTSSDFSKDLDNLTPHIKENVALYVILRQEGKGGDGGVGSCVAVTYVPDKAPVRQKMLFASTRLTLVRELGMSRYRSHPMKHSCYAHDH